MSKITVLTLLLALSAAGNAVALPEKAENFRLTDAAGASHELYRYVDSPAVVLVSYANECPAVQEALPKLKEITAEFGPKGVVFLGLDPNTKDTRETVASKLKDAGLEFPVLMDEAQIVAKAYGCTRLAEAILLDTSANWKIAYRGDIAHLAEAVTALLAKQPVPAGAPTVGCSIDYSAAPAGISYANDVAPILQNKCVSCHHTDGVAPFPMANVKKIQNIADMVREVVLQKRMPPWHADPHFSAFTNDRSLSSQEQATLLAWIDAGAQLDPGAADPLATAKVNDEAWALGPPDTVLTLPEAEELPAEGVLPYRYRYVPSGFTEDKWVRGLEVKAGNPKVVHHALIFVIYPKEYRHLQPNSRSGLGGYFASFLPGAIIKPYPEGTGQWVPAGSTFVFQMHYTVDGKPETDQTKMALYFDKEPPAEEFRIEAAHNNDFMIPPNAMDYGTSAEYSFDKPAKIWALSPHMHYRGSRFRFDVKYPEGAGADATLLNVPHYEFDWQPLYLLKDAVNVPEGTRILCDGGFDNSRFNPKNPNPKAMIHFGEQSFEEMFIGYVAYSVPREDSRRTKLSAEKIARMGFGQPITEQKLIGTKWRMGGQFVIEFMADNRVSANSFIPGIWSMHPGRINIVNPVQPIDLGIVGDELFFNGRSLRYLHGDGSDDQVENWERDGRGGRRRDGPVSPEEQKRRDERRKLWNQFFPGDNKPGDAKPAESAPAAQVSENAPASPSDNKAGA